MEEKSRFEIIYLGYGIYFKRRPRGDLLNICDYCLLNRDIRGCDCININSTISRICRELNRDSTNEDYYVPLFKYRKNERT